MEEYVAVKIDISGKQEYIFSSNKLKEIIGASKIIEFVTEILGSKIIYEMREENLVTNHKFTEEFKIHDEPLRGSVHIEAGGNSIYFFKDTEISEKFIKRFSKYVLEHFAGLELTIVTEEFDLERDLAIALYKKLDKKILKKKNRIPRKLNYLNYGLYNKCDNSGKAQGYEVLELSNSNLSERESKLVSKESYHKRKFYDEILLQKISEETYEFNNEKEDFYDLDRYLAPEEDNILKRNIDWMRSYYISNKEKVLSTIINKDHFTDRTNFTHKEIMDILGGPEDENKMNLRIENLQDITDNSYIGLSCLDGNGMGSTMRKLPKYFAELLRQDLKSYIKTDLDKKLYEKLGEYRWIEEKNGSFSDLVKIVIKENNLFFLKLQEILVEEIQKSFETEMIRLMPDYKIVPIILAGDDITFWTSAKDSIKVSSKFLENLWESSGDSNSIKQNIVDRINKSDVIEGRFKNTESLVLKQGLKNFERLSVSGGIALTKYNYPISQSAKLATSLEKEAKNRTREEKNKDMIGPAVLDWELLRGEQKNEVTDLRLNRKTKRPYIIKSTEKNSEIGKFWDAFGKVNTSESTSYINLLKKGVRDENEAKLFSKQKSIENTGYLHDAIELLNILN